MSNDETKLYDEEARSRKRASNSQCFGRSGRSLSQRDKPPIPAAEP
jgi:hypothetical protein